MFSRPFHLEAPLFKATLKNELAASGIHPPIHSAGEQIMAITC